jgi:hypothetical protein
MKASNDDLSNWINKLGDKATQLLTFLSFAIVAVILLETAEEPEFGSSEKAAMKWALRLWVAALFPILISIFPVKDFKWGDARWYGRARWVKFVLLWVSVFLIISGVLKFLCAIW